MIYLDYAANTPVDDEVLKAFVDTTKEFIANPNSSHDLGELAKEQIDMASSKVAGYFNCEKDNIIYTSGSSESNNLVIKGVALRNKDIGKHIIISAIEHSSVIAPCNFLSSLGYDISIIPLTNNGTIDLNILKQTITEKTILVSICTVDSELGTIQPIEEIAKIVHNYPQCIFHTDATQAIGKVAIDYSSVDFITLAPHKFYGLNGFGALINMHNKKIIPLVHGGKSTTIYRSGTPVTASVVALATALELAINNLDTRFNYISKLNKILRDALSKYSNVHINSPKNSIPNTLNISLIGISAKEVVNKLQEKGIYLSTTTACSIGDLPSKAVMAITKDEQLATNTIRISISHLTSIDEINLFLKEFESILNIE